MTAIAEIKIFQRSRVFFPRVRSIDAISTKDYIARGYHVSMSNDGVTYSEEDVLVIYDSIQLHSGRIHSNLRCPSMYDITYGKYVIFFKIRNILLNTIKFT